jgi:allophanate hydrolase
LQQRHDSFSPKWPNVTNDQNLPLTIAEYQQAYAQGALVESLIHQRWQALSAAVPGTAARPVPDTSRDPAIIFVPDWEMVLTQIDRLKNLKPEDCPLYGVPFAVKDNIDIEGWPTTAACPSFSHVAAGTATAVEQLLKAGAILLAKTNLDQFATGLVGTRSPYGAVPNPFDPDYVSGGSSSGSASLVARGLVCFSLGTDTAGSGRVPAGFCNLVGTKPTPGIVSTHGVLPACKSLDCVSFFSLCVEDAEKILAVCETPSAQKMREPQFHAAPINERWSFGDCPRVGIPDSREGLSQHYEASFLKAMTQAEGLGWQVSAIDMTPLYDVAALLYEGPWVAERYSVIQDLIQGNRPDLDPTVRTVVEKGAGYSAQQAFDALYRLKDLAVQVHEQLQDIDVLMVPTSPQHPRLQEVQQDPIGQNAALGRFTNFVNLLGWSALALPCGIQSNGLPFGITLIARAGHDRALLNLGRIWQSTFPWPLGCRLQDRTTETLPPILNDQPRNGLVIAVVGAHLKGLPLHHQIVSAGARYWKSTRTASRYRLHALANSTPAKPGLQRVSGTEGHSIEVELYEFPMASVGGFLAQIPHPLGLGNIELEDASWVKGFICEPIGLQGAKDISGYHGWRPYLNSLHREG